MQLDEGALAPLLVAADAEAHAFVRRLAIDWQSGAISTCCPRGAGAAARALFAQLLSHAQPHFDRLLLHTERAAAFWERQGFLRFDDECTHSTHALQLRSR